MKTGWGDHKKPSLKLGRDDLGAGEGIMYIIHIYVENHVQLGGVWRKSRTRPMPYFVTHIPQLQFPRESREFLYLPTLLVGNSLLLTVFVAQGCPLHTQLGLQGAWGVVNPTVDHSTVVSTLVMG